MPAIAGSALSRHVRFYWHLGDFRFFGNGPNYKDIVDEDMCQQYNGKMCGDKAGKGELSVEEYRRRAWSDFLANQIGPFGELPVYLGIGNHETYEADNPQCAREDFKRQFDTWLDRPELRYERQKDKGDPQTYYHWKVPPVDFINLDNSLEEGFDPAQLQWLKKVLAEDELDQNVLAIVVGMHRALPNSLACGHSMNGDAIDANDSKKEPKEKANCESTLSGRTAYEMLLDWKKRTNARDSSPKKSVYVLASHSHFILMEKLFDTAYWKKHGDGEVLPGWIVGTAGARRYKLPPELQARTDTVLAKTYAYGYLLGTVHEDGKIDFEFEEVTEKDVSVDVSRRFGKDFLDYCFLANRDDRADRKLPASCADDAGPTSCSLEQPQGCSNNK